jgi:ribosomal protein L37AE/L43A
MPDSTNNKSAEDFNPLQHALEICNGSSIRFEGRMPVNYKIGWADLVKEMLMEIKDTGALLTCISSDYGLLDVQFESCKKIHELRVWRAINAARLNSKRTCTDCGDVGYRHFREDSVVVLCRGCVDKFSGGGRCGRTGTWLDRY